MGIQTQIDRLMGLRWDLADNLTIMGVPSTHEETLEQLVPKVLLILQGNLEVPCFYASLAQFDVSLGYFGMNEEASFAGICSVRSYYLIQELQVIISGTGISSLTITAPGWTQTTQEDGSILLSMQGSNRAEATYGLNAIVIAFDNETLVDAAIKVQTITTEGELIEAEGSTLLVFRPGTTWEMVESAELTWNTLESGNMTWAELESHGKFT